MLFGIVVVYDGFYVVNEGKQVMITQFGKPIGSPKTEAGLYFKVPFLQKVNEFENRWLAWDGDANQMPTLDKRFIWVDTYARWRITDPLLFFQRLQNERGAQSRLDDILDGETRNTIASHNLIEVVRTSKLKWLRHSAALRDDADLDGLCLSRGAACASGAATLRNAPNSFSTSWPTSSRAAPATSTTSICATATDSRLAGKATRRHRSRMPDRKTRNCSPPEERIECRSALTRT